MNFLKSFIMAAVAVAAVSLTAAPGMSANKNTEKIAIDGRLDEAAWASTSSQTNFVYPKSRNGRPAAQTEFKVLTDGDAVYFGIVCKEPLMDKLAANEIPHKGMVYVDDCVEIFLDPTGKRTTYYQFSVTAANVQASEYMIEGGTTSGGYFDPRWQSAVFKGADFWSLEVRIPLTAFYRTQSTEFSKNWVLNICRGRQPVSEHSTWAQVDNGFHDIKHYGIVSGMPQKKASDNIEVSIPEWSNVGADGHGYTGDLQVQIDVEKAAAGKYRLEVDSDKIETHGVAFNLQPGLNKSIIPGLKLKSLGEVVLKIKLVREADGLDGFDACLKTSVDWTPLTVSLKQPFFGRAFFPDQKSDKISGAVAINLPEASGIERILRINAAGAGLKQQLELPVGKSPVAFELDSSGMTTDGAVILTFALLEAGKEIAKDTTAVRLLAKTGHTMVRIDEYQRLVVNGKPMFGIGWYGSGGYMVTPPFLAKYPTPQAKCPAVNMHSEWVNVEPERLCPDLKVEMNKDIRPSQKIFDAVKKTIDANRNKDFWFYYLCDEPECRGISRVYLKHMYNYIKELDPSHPVMIISRDPVESVKACDVINPHSYLQPRFTPDFKRNPHSVTKQQAMWKLAGSLVKGQPKVFIFCPQTFTYSFMDRFAANPVFEELNPMFWDAVAHGAVGVTPFIYYAYPATPSMELGIEFLFESMSTLGDLVTAPVLPLDLNVESSSGNVDAWAKQSSGNLLLVVVNPENIPAAVSISGRELPVSGELYNFREAGKTKIEGGMLKLKLAPLEVKIFTTKKMDDKLISLEDVKKNIAEKEKELPKPGNILFNRGRDIEVSFSKCVHVATITQESLTDGITDLYSWREIADGRKESPFLEMQFPSFVPRFSRIVIYGENLDGTIVKIWKSGEWKTLTPVNVKTGKYLLDYTFDTTYTTVKVRLEMPKTGGKGGIYEIEMY